MTVKEAAHPGRVWFAACALAGAVLLAACAPAAPPLEGAADAVERYITAKAAADEAGVRAGLCSAMEAMLVREATSFSAVTGATVEDMACTASADGDGRAAVVCTGAIVAQYGADATEFPLRTYNAVLEDGEWKWCGERAAP